MAVAPATAKLLIVDDETAHMTALCDTLKDAGYATTGCSSAKQALRALREQEFDLVLTDLMMPEMDGISLLAAAQEIDHHLVAIVMTGHGAIDTAVEAMKAGAIDYIQKPFRLSKIQPVLSRALMVRRLRTENIQLREAIVIHELTTAFTGALDWRTVVAKAADAAFAQSENGSTSVFTLSADGTHLHVAAARGKHAEQLMDLTVPFDADLKLWLEAVRVRLANSNWDQAALASTAPVANVDLGISIPMLAGGNFVGLLNFKSGNANRSPTIGQLKTLSGLANAAASALEITLLLDQLHRANQDLERRVQQRTIQLEAANKELEAFSFSISHDLRAPLRAIDGYASILLTDCAADLSSQTQQSAEAIRASSHRAMQLIEDLLELSRLGFQPLQKQRVHTISLVRHVADEVVLSDANRRVDVQIDALPDCMGDQALLKQVLINLLSNAAKFTRRSQHPHIHISSREETGETVYWVRDNGAGFDMQQADKLFGVFQRLHSAKDFEGTGIGLSIVQRIIGRHGGRVWAEGAVGQGATFYFSLPHSTD
jgi:signal transduction histidine kinase/FixJ family two-component response regulator